MSILQALIAEKLSGGRLAPVATSGSYNDLSNKPTIPTVPTEEISANTAARHTHSNKIVLDGITAAKLLPAVTPSDNDKFLRVVSGVWAAVTVPSAESNSF